MEIESSPVGELFEGHQAPTEPGHLRTVAGKVSEQDIFPGGGCRATFGMVGTLGATLPATAPVDSLVLEFILTQHHWIYWVAPILGAVVIKIFS